MADTPTDSVVPSFALDGERERLGAIREAFIVGYAQACADCKGGEPYGFREDGEIAWTDQDPPPPLREAQQPRDGLAFGWERLRAALMWLEEATRLDHEWDKSEVRAAIMEVAKMSARSKPEAQQPEALGSYWMVERTIEGRAHWLRWRGERIWTADAQTADHYTLAVQAGRDARWVREYDGHECVVTEHRDMEPRP